MPRGKKKSSVSHHGLLQAIEQQYLSALKFSRDQLDKRIRALEEMSPGAPAPTPAGQGNATGKAKSGSSSAAKPRNYDLLKAKITKPMTMKEILTALSLKPKQIGNIQQMMRKYKGLLKSDGKRPATYTLDASR